MPTAVLLNTLKHHLLFIQQFVTTYPENALSELTDKLLPIGNSQMDLYTGKLLPEQLAQEVVQKLHQQNITTEATYKEFLLPAYFQIVTLSDASRWVLRWGEREGQYIHIHPGRYSPHTVRVKATSLKTAIATHILQRFSTQVPDTGWLNQIRNDYLDLPPVKYGTEIQGIQKVINLLKNV